MTGILLVKTSSLGDVIHNLPVVSDIRTRIPDATIDWVVEESFADIPALHPGVRQVIPVAVRRWRNGWLKTKTREEIGVLRRRLQAERYDFIVDTQGLMKSAVLARLARGRHCGYDWGSAREPAASLFYGATFAAPKALHAVTRNRLLAASCLGYEIPAELDYGIPPSPSPHPGDRPAWQPAKPFVVLLHATSRNEKLWPEANWIALGRHIAQSGWVSVLPWSTPEEEERSHRLAGHIAEAVAPPRMRLEALARLFSQARAVVGVDTGLAHLAAALRVPVVGIYCATDPGLTGVLATANGKNVGGRDGPPTPQAVVAALEEVMPS